MLKQQFDAVNDTATEQKKQDHATKLIDDILDKDNPFKNINTEDIWIEDNLFDNNDKEAIKEVSKNIIDTANDITIPDNPTETTVINDEVDIPLPSDNGIDIDTGPSRIRNMEP